MIMLVAIDDKQSKKGKLKLKDIADLQRLGYELIYADTDSVFIKNPNRGTAANCLQRKK
jgi:hypothetical protein